MEAPLNGHLTPAELQAALRAELSRVRWQQVVRHLLRGCEECRTLLASGLRSTASSPEREADYDHALDVSFARVLQTGRLVKARGRRANAQAANSTNTPSVAQRRLLIASPFRPLQTLRIPPREMTRCRHRVTGTWAPTLRRRGVVLPEIASTARLIAD